MSHTDFPDTQMPFVFTEVLTVAELLKDTIVLVQVVDEDVVKLAVGF